MSSSISRYGFDFQHSNTEEAPWGRWAGVKLHGMVVALVVLLSVLLENPSAILVVGGILCTPTYLLLGVIEARRTPLLFSPLSFYFFWYSIGLGLSAIYVGIVAATSESLPFSVVMISPDNLAKAYAIFLVGSVALHTGLQSFRPTRPVEGSKNEGGLGVWRPPWLVVMWAIGLWSTWNVSFISPLGAPGRILPWLSVAALCAFAITPRECFRLARTAFAGLLAIGVLGQFAASLMSGSKSYIMFSFFPLIWLCVMRRQLRRWIPIAGLVLTTLYFTVVAPVVTVARYIPEHHGGTAAERLLTTFKGEGTVSADSYYDISYIDRIKMLLDRQFDPYPLGFFVEDVELNGLRHGTTMDYITDAFIPRVLWPGKPNVTRGDWFATYIGFSASVEEATTSLGITATGELYWNFGVLGVAFGMYIFGCLLAGLWRIAGFYPLSHPARMILYVMVMMNMPFMSEAVSLLVSIVVNFIVFKAVFVAIKMTQESKGVTHVAIAS